MKKGQLADVRKRSKESGLRSENGVLGSTEGRRRTNGKPGVGNRRAEEHTSIFKKPGEICLEHSNPQRNPETDTKRETDGKAEETGPIGLRIKRRKNQATKSTGWMPRHHTPMKDAVSCEKLRVVASELRSADLRMGKPSQSHVWLSWTESIGA